MTKNQQQLRGLGEGDRDVQIPKRLHGNASSSDPTESLRLEEKRAGFSVELFSLVVTPMRRRLLISTALRPACRRAFRSALRRSILGALHRRSRRLLRDNRPSLHELCNLVSRCVRMAEAFEKKSNPPSRFKTLGTPEEHRRQVEQDLQRAYGEDSAFRGHTVAQPAPPPSPPPAIAAQTPSPAASQPPPKRDVVAVPLVRLSNGLLGLDWSAG